MKTVFVTNRNSRFKIHRCGVFGRKTVSIHVTRSKKVNKKVDFISSEAK